MTRPRGLVNIDLQRDGRVFICPYSASVDGPWLANGLPKVLDSLDDVAAVGSAVLEAMQLSRNTVLPARDLRNDPPDREFLAWVGKRSYAAYAKGVRAAEVNGFYDEGGATLDHLIVTPMSNGGPRSGFEPIIEHDQELTDLSPEVIGEALQRAMPLATV